MKIFDISILGWLHTAACMIALMAGPLVFALRKGSSRHRLLGYWYAGSMVVANITALGLFAPIPGLPTFNRFHWMAIATLTMITLGVWAARHQRSWLGAYGHPIIMIISFDMLLGGAINEAFTRIAPLRAAAMAGSPWAHNLLQTRMLGMTQSTAVLLCLAIMVWFVVGVARSRRRRPMELVPAE